MQKRRYEILLPTQYNDGRTIMDECMVCFPQTLMEVLDQFGALSYTPQAIQGVWIQNGTRYEDNLGRVGRQRVTMQVLFCRPLLEPCVPLSRHTALR